jgi:hypothetical protein
MQQAAEDRKSGEAVEFLADHFTGNNGISKTELRRIMMGLFLRHQNVNVSISRMDIKVNPQDPYSARMESVVILTGAQSILPQDASIYTITGEWHYLDGEWLLVRAEWE